MRSCASSVVNGLPNLTEASSAALMEAASASLYLRRDSAATATKMTSPMARTTPATTQDCDRSREPNPTNTAPSTAAITSTTNEIRGESLTLNDAPGKLGRKKSRARHRVVFDAGSQG